MELFVSFVGLCVVFVNCYLDFGFYCGFCGCIGCLVRFVACGLGCGLGVCGLAGCGFLCFCLVFNLVVACVTLWLLDCFVV